MWGRLKVAIYEYRLLLSLVATAFVLLFWNSSERSFWMDETMVLNYFKYGLIDFFKAYLENPDNHPPLYYFLVLIISKVLPWSEFAVRLVSILSGIGIVGFVYLFTFRFSQNKVVSFVAAFFTAFSSFFVLISQMARYHSTAAFFSLLTFYFFYLLVFEKYNWRNLIGYIVFLLFTAYSDYPHFIYSALFTNIYFIYTLLKKRPIVSPAKWFVGQFLAALVCLPLAYMLYHRIFIQGDGGWANLNLLSNSWLNIFAGIFFHFYVFFFGENIFPWNYFVFIPGFLVLFSALFLLIKNLILKRFTERERYLIVVAASIVVLNTIFMNKADSRYNFTIYPKFGFVAFPFFIIVLTVCLNAIKSVWYKLFLFVIWLMVATVGLVHFYSLNNYLNGSYFRDFRPFEFVRDSSEKGEYLAITPDASEGVYDFYKGKYFSNLIPLDYNSFYAGKVSEGAEVWFFSTASDGPGSSVFTDDLIPSGYSVIKRYDSVPLDSDFKKYKEKFLHRPSYLFKYSVFLLKKI